MKHISPEQAEEMFAKSLMTLEELEPSMDDDSFRNIHEALELLGNVLHILTHINIHSLREGIHAAKQCEQQFKDSHGRH